MAAADAREGAVKIHQDVDLSVAYLSQRARLGYSLKPGRQAWLQVTRGAIKLDETPLNAGDGAAVTEQRNLHISAAIDAEILLFDLS